MPDLNDYKETANAGQQTAPAKSLGAALGSLGQAQTIPWNNWQQQSYQRPCPSCGHCPTCGHQRTYYWMNTQVAPNAYASGYPSYLTAN